MSSHPQINTQSAKGPLGVCGKASPHLSSSHPGSILSSRLSPSPPLELQPPCLLLLHPFSLTPSHSLSIFHYLPPTNYLQDYRFSVGCDWVSLGVMQALRCLLNGEHHELWTNYSHSSTTPELQADTVYTHTHKHTNTHTHKHTHAHTHRTAFPQCNTRTRTLIVLTHSDTYTHRWSDAHCWQYLNLHRTYRYHFIIRAHRNLFFDEIFVFGNKNKEICFCFFVFQILFYFFFIFLDFQSTVFFSCFSHGL